MRSKRRFGPIAVVMLLLFVASGLTYAQDPRDRGSLSPQTVMGTTFTYQGRLTDGGSPANGAYDLQFRLYDDADGGAQVGTAIVVEDQQVEEGLFTVELDFGARSFTGEARYLEIGVRPGGSIGAYTTLSPRQPVTAAPFALSLPGLYTLPNSFSPNVVGGATSNLAWDGLVGATISGGGGEEIENLVTDFFGTIGGGANNLAGNESEDVTDAWYATVAGGWQNTASDVNATVVGGAENTASGVSSFVGGGFQNEASGFLHATVCGGEANQASGENNATVGGGFRNVASGYWNATVAGGANNVASGDEATVGGGAENSASGEYNATVSGGYRNTASSTDATVAGGNSNTAGGWAATVSGGYTNTVTADAATVGGGQANYASGDLATIAGGFNNRATADYASIGGGGGEDLDANWVSDEFGTVAGGQGNWAGNGDPESDNRPYATVGGGHWNSAKGAGSTVGGGDRNAATGLAATVGGGRRNEGNADHSVVAGGYWNVTYGITSTISGGQQNFINRDYATIGGGHNNQIYADYGTVGGGGGQGDANANIVYDNGGTIAGGTANRAGTDNSDPADAADATVGGGTRNHSRGESATVAGGGWNLAAGTGATVGGGYANSAFGDYATVAGGGPVDLGGPAVLGNYATEDYAAVAGGGGNLAGNNNGDPDDAAFAAVAGGRENTAMGEASFVGGGRDNEARGDYATVAGGLGNQATGVGATVGGGGSIPSIIQPYPNVATGGHSTIAGGSGNSATGLFATVPGGSENLAQGDRSLAAGHRAKANYDGCFVWGDSTSANVACQADDEFVVRASGGVYLYTSGDLSSGAYLGPGMSDWNPLPPPSDRHLKEHVVPIDPQAVLEQIVTVPVSTWNYKRGDPAIRHMGPMAQDFYAAFGLGEDERHISTIDADGVAFAAIQGLHERSQAQAAHIEALEAENAALQDQLNDLEARMRALERGASGSARATLLPGAGILMAGIGAVWAVRRRGLLEPIVGGDR